MTVELAVAQHRAALVEPSRTVAAARAGWGRGRLSLQLRAAARWGAHAVGPLLVGARTAGITVWGSEHRTSVDWRVSRPSNGCGSWAPRPHAAVHRSSRRRARRGNRVRRRAGLSGWRSVRHVHWRATARRGSLQVNDRHPEQPTDVVLLVDTFEEARTAPAGRSMLPCAPSRAGPGTSGPSRPRRRSRLRRHAPLARAGVRHGAAVPDRRCADRERDRV